MVIILRFLEQLHQLTLSSIVQYLPQNLAINSHLKRFFSHFRWNWLSKVSQFFICRVQFLLRKCSLSGDILVTCISCYGSWYFKLSAYDKSAVNSMDPQGLGLPPLPTHSPPPLPALWLPSGFSLYLGLWVCSFVIYPAWGSLSILDLWLDFHDFWQILGHYAFKQFFCLIASLFFFVQLHLPQSSWTLMLCSAPDPTFFSLFVFQFG